MRAPVAGALALLCLTGCETELEPEQIQRLEKVYDQLDYGDRVVIAKNLRYGGLTDDTLTLKWDEDLGNSLAEAYGLLGWDYELSLDTEAGAARFYDTLTTREGRTSLAEWEVDPDEPWHLTRAGDGEMTIDGYKCTIYIGDYTRRGETAALWLYTLSADGGGMIIHWDGWTGSLSPTFYGFEAGGDSWGTNGEIKSVTELNAELDAYNDTGVILNMLEKADSITLSANRDRYPMDPFRFEEGAFRDAALKLKKCPKPVYERDW